VPTFNCSPPVRPGVARSTCLVYDGACVPLTVRSDSGQPLKLQAKIDTGSQFTIIEEDLAVQLQLVKVDEAIINTANQPNVLLSVYRAELEIPPLGIREWARVLGGAATLLGREQLGECELVYSGPSGNVTLRR
jgi:predicted aspartyl protease